MRRLIAGNWKMNGYRASLDEARAVAAAAGDVDADLLLCPPATLIGAVADAARGTNLMVGGQNLHAESCGARTGDVSAEMLADAGATHCITGHSERRADCHEDDAAVRAKTQAAWRAGLTAIVCVGETLAQRDAGETLAVVARQLAGSIPDGASPKNTVVAYEPVWAIGTGRTPTIGQVAEVHAAIHAALAERFGQTFRILYGGSVKPDNAAALLAAPHVGGALVGGASLKAADFLAIARAAPAGGPERDADGAGQAAAAGAP